MEKLHVKIFSLTLTFTAVLGVTVFAQAQTAGGVTVAITRGPHPAWEGKPAGDVQSFERNNKDLKIALLSQPIPDIWSPQSAQEAYDRDIAWINKCTASMVKLEQVEIDAPDGKRKISDLEAENLVYFARRASANLINQAKEKRKNGKIARLSRATQQSLAADGAIARFSSNPFPSAWMLIARRS
jgi:hypothetical protein